MIIADFTGRFHFTSSVEKFQLSEEKGKKLSEVCKNLPIVQTQFQ
jgi:hypothetical protein